jgi:hypothetical protein
MGVICMSEDNVTIQLKVPRVLHAFVAKMADLEGTKPSDFYEEWIHREFYATVTDSDEELGLDMKAAREHNQLNKVLQDC